jgi:glutathione peroxidase-family protein
VLGFPCNQFMGQEPGSAEEIREFCDTNYHVTFPVFEKIDVNGDQRHPVYGRSPRPRMPTAGRRREVELREVLVSPQARWSVAPAADT